jgi:hypothetical protein
MNDYYASNKLYNNEAGSFQEAIELHIAALRNEARVMDGICEPDDDFPQRLRDEAEQADKLLRELNDHMSRALSEIVDKWLSGDNEMARSFAECETDGSYSSLAI